jgi:steroid delta-isomerase-like uncharacterized protein
MKTEKEVIAKSKGPDSLEENKNLIRRAIEEIWNGRNYDNVEEFISRDFVVHAATPGEEIHGPEGARQFHIQLRKAFPDIHFTVEDQIAEGDRVVTQWTAKGTHKGEFKGMPPTGKQFKVTAIDIDRIEKGKVVECWTKMDELGLLRQLGGM